MYLLQEIARNQNPKAHDHICTLGLFETVAEAHQAAINRCHEYVRENHMVWSAPQYDGTWQKGETLTGEFAGDNWKQIAPLGYEWTHGKRVAWLRIESVAVKS